MSDLFKATVETLTACIGLNPPEDDKDIISLKIDEQECHITEHPQGHLLMFSSLGPLENYNELVLLNSSMFNQEVKSPVIGYDKEHDHVILWSRQSLNEVNRENAYQQLEILTQFYDVIVKENESLPNQSQGNIKQKEGSKSIPPSPSKRAVFPRF